MILEIFLACLLGIIAGTITGLIPGVHINLVATLLFINSAFFLGFTNPLILAIFIISMTTAHTFIDFIPSVFLGAPNEDTVLSILPGHRMLLEGRGYEAVKLTVIGGFLGLVLACVLTPLFIFTAPIFYPLLEKMMAFILISLSLILIFTEKRKFAAFFVFILAGLLGLGTLNFSLLKQALFPLFTGLFATPLLILSFVQNVKIPKQRITKVDISKKEIIKILGVSIFSSSLVSFLPGVGSAQAAVIASVFKKIKEKSFLVLLGAINTLVVLLSFVALYAIKKPRSGVAVFVGKFLPDITLSNLWTLLIVSLIVGVFAFFISLILAKEFSTIIKKVNYKWLCFAILLFLIILTPIISNWWGLLVLLTATALGIFCSLIGIKKIFLMGALLLPVIIYYLI
ncbi:MAG: tripartite tricarboxylate transporter permease [Candidatus Pacearchaeota archaeon]|nr:tripartite tricarboxylate transporter permease [Candidatus Pacearchaeota archaeon]